MSTARARPTREETRSRLFVAAARVFADRGIAGTTVEEIAGAAGFTRGAFYSNFRTIDDLAVAMLDDHLARSRAHNLSLAAEHPEADGLVAALRADLGRPADPLHDSPLLRIELLLYVARRADLRPRLGEQLRAMRALVGELAAAALAAEGRQPDVPPERLGLVLLAVEDGLKLHRLVDPDATPADAFPDALDTLRALVAP